MQNWTPFERASLRLDRVHNPDWATVNDSDPADEIWINSLYQVAIFRKVPVGEGWTAKMIQLSIKRVDRKAIHDWRDLQRIKNELVGPENEAVEVYPAESRLVDTANQFFLWVFADPTIRLPFGFSTRWVNNVSGNGVVQRPFPFDRMPSDCKPISEALRKRVAELKVEKDVAAPIS